MAEGELVIKAKATNLASALLAAAIAAPCAESFLALRGRRSRSLELFVFDGNLLRLENEKIKHTVVFLSTDFDIGLSKGYEKNDEKSLVSKRAKM